MSEIITPSYSCEVQLLTQVDEKDRISIKYLSGMSIVDAMKQSQRIRFNEVLTMSLHIIDGQSILNILPTI